MKIKECFSGNEPVFSFEFFPPRTDEALEDLYTTIAELAPLNPSFVSVTYGAGGSTRQRTVDLVGRIKSEIGLEAMAHLTCVGHSREDLTAVLDRLQDQGLENVLALRGDPPRGQEAFTPAADGFQFGSELVRFIRSRYDFCLGAACYPEGHIESRDKESDLRNLKVKADSGADFLITQLFFNHEDYFRFVDRARAIGISLPILPGIMPVTNVKQLARFTTMCGASIPPPLWNMLEPISEDAEAVICAGIDWASRQCAELLRGGAPGIHFYTLNRSRSTRTVYQNMRADR